MTASPTLSQVDYQCLAALARFGRKRLLAAWSALPANRTADGQSIEPLALGDEHGQRLLAALGPAELPWQILAEQMQRLGISAIMGSSLPSCLRQVPDPPLALYLRGQPGLLRQPAVAIVGARRASQRGLSWARRIAAELSQSGLQVVSGLALGVDAAAHLGAVDVGAGTTAVLGSGLARPSPQRNLRLMARLLEAGGTVVSEYPLTQNASKYSFPERNRIITGLALGLVVVEAGARSGTLISARLALEQGRDVMAVPGPVGVPGSVGCHRLIKQGAALVESAVDVLEVLNCQELAPLGPLPGAVHERLPQDPAAASLLQQIDGQVTSVDALIAASELQAPTVTALLTSLELEGFVQRVAEGYIRSP